MDMRKWFKEAQYGMMVHWGLYSLLAGEYKDRYSGVYAQRTSEEPLRSAAGFSVSVTSAHSYL